MIMKNNKLTIVSRKSRLALQQANIVKQHLHNLYPNINIEIIGISTIGDQILDQSLNKIGGKGLFVSELENYLLTEQADIAVHSMKDMPSMLAPGLVIGAILERADPRDVFVSEKFTNLQQLPAGSIVGTSSLRRQAQVLAIKNNVEIAALRGNVETRLQKLVAGQYDAIILAAAGLERLGLSQWLKVPLDTAVMLPAVGQGALGVEYNSAREDLKSLLTPLNHAATAICVNAERAMNAALDGGCQAPIAGFATIQADLLTLHGLVASSDGAQILRATQIGPIQDATQIGEKVAQQLLAQGAAIIIQNLKDLSQKDGW